MIRLSDLMTCQTFELIGCFLHVIPIEEEIKMASDCHRKIRHLQNHIKKKCRELYQPLQHLSVDERMVKSKARWHLVQYVKNKPCKWGFKCWVLADRSGYTVNFNVYARKSTEKSEDGLSTDVVMQLTAPFKGQGYVITITHP